MYLLRLRGECRGAAVTDVVRLAGITPRGSLCSPPSPQAEEGQD